MVEALEVAMAEATAVDMEEAMAEATAVAMAVVMDMGIHNPILIPMAMVMAEVSFKHSLRLS